MSVTTSDGKIDCINAFEVSFQTDLPQFQANKSLKHFIRDFLKEQVSKKMKLFRVISMSLAKSLKE